MKKDLDLKHIVIGHKRASILELETPQAAGKNLTKAEIERILMKRIHELELAQESIIFSRNEQLRLRMKAETRIAAFYDYFAFPGLIFPPQLTRILNEIARERKEQEK